MPKDYSYQQGLIQKTYAHLLTDKICVLAACPGAGKTNMALNIIQKYRKDFPSAKVLVLTHGQNILRKQFYERAKSLNIKGIQEIKATTPFKADKNIMITLPQTMVKRQGEFDLLIVDEAHNFYDANMVQEITKATKVKHQLLLTGTPSEFIDRYPIVSITLSELVQKELLIDPVIQLKRCSLNLNFEDFHPTYEVKSHKILTQDSLKAFKQLKIDPDSKTMVICYSQEHAKAIHAYLLSKKYKSSLSISCLRGDVSAFEEFKTKTNFLVVVRRGILGFDYPDLCTVIDLTLSLNINRLFQQICRVVRNSANKKTYIKIYPENLEQKYMVAMYSCIAMAQPEHYLRPRVDKDIPVRYNAGNVAFQENICFGDFNYYVKDSLTINLLGMRDGYYTEEEALSEFKKYKSYYELKLSDHRLYKFIIRRYPDMLRAFKDAPKVRLTWSLEAAEIEMKKFRQKTVFKQESLSCYKYMLKNHRAKFDSYFNTQYRPATIAAIMKNSKWAKRRYGFAEIEKILAANQQG